VGSGDIVAVLDLRTARAGQRLFQLTPEQVRVPFGVQVVQVTPATIPLVFENSATRTVPVHPATDGTPAPGYVVTGVVTNPNTVEVVGPQSAVERTTEAVTEPVSIAGARQPVTERVTIGFVDPSLRLKTPRPADVTVQVQLGPLERALRDRPVYLRNLGPGLLAQAIPASVQVTVRGSREGLSHVRGDAVTAFVDLAGLGAGDYMLNVRADASQEVGVVRVDPAVVQVRVSSGRN
jgi:YbbR domain-containing protein